MSSVVLIARTTLRKGQFSCCEKSARKRDGTLPGAYDHKNTIIIHGVYMHKMVALNYVYACRDLITHISTAGRKLIEAQPSGMSLLHVYIYTSQWLACCFPQRVQWVIWSGEVSLLFCSVYTPTVLLPVTAVLKIVREEHARWVTIHVHCIHYAQGSVSVMYMYVLSS